MKFDRNFIKHNIGKGLVVIIHVLTRLQIVDIFTKRLPQGKFQDFVGMLGMINNHLPT